MINTLSQDERIALKVMTQFKPFAREENYFFTKYRRYSYDNANEYKETLVELAKKELVKIASNGAVRLTKIGKELSWALPQV